MPYALYVCLQDEDKIAVFAMDAETGQLTRQTEVPAVGGPSVMAMSPDRRTLYVGQRAGPAISSFRIDPATGGMTLTGTASQPHAPTFLALDRTGKFLLSAYYQGGGAAVYRLGSDGSVGAASHDWLATDTGAHAIATDPSNRQAKPPKDFHGAGADLTALHVRRVVGRAALGDDDIDAAPSQIHGQR
jgi:6-phosphogluconolactonase